MNISQVFDSLQLPRNENVELASLLASPLAEIWTSYPDLAPWTKDAAGQLQPFYPRYARLKQVQVLGLNPSYTAADRAAADYLVDFTKHPYFRRTGRFGEQVAARYQQLFQDPTHSSSEQFYLGELEWGHLDLLYMRTTSQRVLEKQVWAEPGAASFVWQQLQLTKRLLAALQPVAIVVANRFGQRLAGFHHDIETGTNEWMGLQFAAEPDALGAYRIVGSTTNRQPDPNGAYGLAGTPVFFTGSFAGTNPRNSAADEQLIVSVAQICLHGGTRYFEQWHMK